MGIFDRYTRDARRSIFFARFEAQLRGATAISPEDILLGVCHDKDTRLDRLIGLSRSVDALRTQIKAKFPPKEPLPKAMNELDNPSKRILAYAAEETAMQNAWWVDSSYLVLGILREGGFSGDLLVNNGVTLDLLREKLRNDPEPEPPRPRDSIRFKILVTLLIITALVAAVVTILKAIPY